MRVGIWKIKEEKWFYINNVKHVYLSVGKTYFEIDHREYRTSEYDLQFINSEV